LFSLKFLISNFFVSAPFLQAANIFHRPQTFLSKREHFFIGRKHFSSNAKGGREHFLWAANISQQARTFFMGRKHFPSSAKGGREHFPQAANISI
jgi:hypothetical protein